MPLTYFLAQFIGLFFLFAGLSVLARKKLFGEVIKDIEGSQALLYTLGLISVLLGLLMVLARTQMDGSIAGLVLAIIGWILVLKGILAMFVPRKSIVQLTKMVKIEKFYWAYGMFVVLVGFYLTYAGFTGL